MIKCSAFKFGKTFKVSAQIRVSLLGAPAGFTAQLWRPGIFRDQAVGDLEIFSSGSMASWSKRWPVTSSSFNDGV